MLLKLTDDCTYGKASSESGEKKKTYGKKQTEDKVVKKLPILKFGKGSNSLKFKSALSEMALEEYGDLGKLIKKEAYYIPQFITPILERVLLKCQKMQ